MSNANFQVSFWGVRGTIPTPDARHLRYGGHTSCVSMRCGDHTLVFDMGTGLYPLGETLDEVQHLDIFLSHTHLDHIMGFPFFSPAYRDDKTIRVYAGHLLPEGQKLRETLSLVMSPPIFPLTLDFLKAKVTYHDFMAGDTPPCPHLAKAGIRITTLALNHPDRATAYRVDFAGHSACYVTDVEHLADGLDQALIAFIKDADLFIYDSTFDDRDFHRFKGWGHSTWQQAVRLADAANVKQLALFHHDPGSTDDVLDARAKELDVLRPNGGGIISQEGMVIDLCAAEDFSEEEPFATASVGC